MSARPAAVWLTLDQVIVGYPLTAGAFGGVMPQGLVVLLALLAAVCSAIGIVIRQRATMEVPADRGVSTAMLATLVRKRLWWAGTAAAVRVADQRVARGSTGHSRRVDVGLGPHGRVGGVCARGPAPARPLPVAAGHVDRGDDHRGAAGARVRHGRGPHLGPPAGGPARGGGGGAVRRGRGADQDHDARAG